MFLTVGSLLSIAVWYLTPVSDLVVQEILLPQVPIQSDIEMGKRALLELKGNDRSDDGARMRSSSDRPSSSASASRDVFDPRWSPLIESIGWELVDTAMRLATNSAKTSSGSDHRLTTSSTATLDPRILREYAWDFGIIQDDNHRDMVNAFCLPGGIIRITLPLLQQLPTLTEGELAALLGHEMGHAIHRHAQARRLQHQVVEYILRALVYDDRDDQHDETFGEALGELLVKSADWLGQQSFSRSNEYEADGTSWDLLYHSVRGYDPRALQSLLQKLWDHQGRQGGGKTSWESTHPGTLDRIQALQEKYDTLTASQKRKLERRNTIS